jgi:hypothetical protein
VALVERELGAREVVVFAGDASGGSPRPSAGGVPGRPGRNPGELGLGASAAFRIDREPRSAKVHEVGVRLLWALADQSELPHWIGEDEPPAPSVTP